MPLEHAGNPAWQTGVTPIDVVDFWTGAGSDAWYDVDEGLDARIRDQFQETWELACAADFEAFHLKHWFESPVAMLGLVILLDQFPRNMFRGEARAFASDSRARKVAKQAIDKGWDERIGNDLQQFFYLPLMHSEGLEDQDRAVRLFKARMERAGSNLLHARAHREIIRRYGRFPFRNEALGRSNTPAEAEFLASGGYGQIVRELQSEE